MRQRLRRWWSSRCWVVRSGFDSTWRASNVDVACWWGVPRWGAVRRARASIVDSYPRTGRHAVLLRVYRWRMVDRSGRRYRGWRVVFDKSGVFQAIYGMEPPAGL